MKCWKGFRVLLTAALAAALALPVGAEADTDFVKAVNRLPKPETVKALSSAEQQALYAHIDTLWEDGFYALSKDAQEKLEATPQYTALAALTEYLNNAQITQPSWLDSGMLRLSGEDLKDGEDYYYDKDAAEVVITGTKPVTVTMAEGVKVSTDTLRIQGEAQIVLQDVRIEATEGKSALTAEGGLKLTLIGVNTMTARDHAALEGLEGVTLSGPGSLTVFGGAGSDGIGAKSLTVTGGTLTVTGGDGAPGTEDAPGGDGGRAVGTDVLSITGGSVKLDGGKAGSDGGSGAGNDGAAAACVPTGEGKPLAQTVVTLTDKDGKAVEGTAVTALALSPDMTYGVQGIVTDETGSIYLYLPQDTKANAVSDGSETYTGTPIASGERGVMTLAQGSGTTPTDPAPSGTTAAPSTDAPTTTPTTAPTTTPTTAPTTAPTTTPKAKQDAPILEEEPNTRTASSVTLKKPTGGIGQVMYAYGLTDQKPDTNWVDTNIFLNLKSGKTYYFYAYYTGGDQTEASPVSKPLAITLSSGFADGSIRVVGGEKTYDGKSMSLTVTVPEGATIRYREGTSGDYIQGSIPTYTNAGTYQIGYRVTQEGYDTVVGSVTIKINPAKPTIALADQTVKHDGNTHPMGGAKVTGVNGESFKGSVTYTYYTDGQCTQGETRTPPSAAGTYYVRASIPAGGNYTAAVSNTAKLVIEKTGSSTTKPTVGGSTNNSGNTAGNGYTITATAGIGGTITQSGKISVQSGKSASFTIVADKEYEVEDVKVDGKSIGSVGVYTFTDVKANHTIEATFRRKVAETTAPTTEPTTVPTEETTVPTTETVPETTEQIKQPTRKHRIPIVVPILLVVLAGGAIGGAVYIYKRYDQE